MLECTHTSLGRANAIFSGTYWSLVISAEVRKTRSHPDQLG